MSMQLPQHTQRGLVVLSPTRVQEGQHCLRKHILSDMLSYVPLVGTGQKSPSLEFGERMHHAIALRWLESIELGNEYLLSCTWPINDKHTLAQANKLYAAYAHTAKPMPYGDGDWLFLSVEKRIVVPVRSKLALSFQIDRLMQRGSDGALALFDVKTAYRCDQRWAKQWPRSLQMKLYSAAVRKHYGRNLDWLVIEGLDKSNGTLNYVVVPEVSEEKQDEAWRNLDWVALHDELLLDAATLPDGTVDADKLCHLALTQTPFNDGECFSYNSECPFLGLCDAEPNERLALLREGYVYVEPEYV